VSNRTWTCFVACITAAKADSISQQTTQQSIHPTLAVCKFPCRYLLHSHSLQGLAANLLPPPNLTLPLHPSHLHRNMLCLQAWGLMELQKGNFWAAVRLLERSVVMDPFLMPVLRWKPVTAARNTIAGSSRYRPLRTRGVACASQGTGAAANMTAASTAGATGGSSSSSVCSSSAASSGGSSISGGGATGGSCMSSM